MHVLDSLVRDLRFALRLMRQTPARQRRRDAVARARHRRQRRHLQSRQRADAQGAADSRAGSAGRARAAECRRHRAQPNRSFTNPQWEYIRDHQDFFGGVLASGNARFNLNAGGEARPVIGIFVNGRFFDVLGVTPVRRPHVHAMTTGAAAARTARSRCSAIAFWQREYGGDRRRRHAAFNSTATRSPSSASRRRASSASKWAAPSTSRCRSAPSRSSAAPRARSIAAAAGGCASMARLAPGQTIEQAEARLAAFHPGLREATMPQDWRPQDQKTLHRTPVQARSRRRPASPDLRVRYSRPLLRAARHRRAGAADRVREHGQPAARAVDGAAARARDPAVARRVALADRPSAAHREPAAVVHRRRRRDPAGHLGQPGAGAADLDAQQHRVRSISRSTGACSASRSASACSPACSSASRRRCAPPGSDAGRRACAITHAASSSGGGRFNLGHGLVALQVAVSFVLVLGASLFVRTLVDLSQQDMGFQPDRVLIAIVDLRRTGADRQGASGDVRTAARGRGRGARRRGRGRVGGHADEQQRRGTT